MASRALTARLRMRFPAGLGRPRPARCRRRRTASIYDCSPRERRRKSYMPPMNRLRSSSFGSSGCRREKARSRCVSVAARCVPDRVVDHRPAVATVARGPDCARDLEIADDDGEQIVEVVGHAAGDLSDRLHLLRLEAAPRLLPRAIMRLPAFRDVTGDLATRGLPPSSRIGSIRHPPRSGCRPVAPAALPLRARPARPLELAVKGSPRRRASFRVEWRTSADDSSLRVALDALRAVIPPGDEP